MRALNISNELIATHNRVLNSDLLSSIDIVKAFEEAQWRSC